MPTLVVTSGPLAGERIELTGELIIGREHADLTIDDPEISRRHAAIRVSEGGVELEDLGSTNGTLVDGVKIAAPVLLGGGERVQLGETAIEIEVEIEEAVDDGATRLHQSPADADLTVMRPTPTAPEPAATAAYATPSPPEPEPVPSAPPEPVTARAETAPPQPAPPAVEPVPAVAAAPRAQPGLPAQPFGTFTPTAGGRAGRHKGVATRLWVPAVLTFATIGGTAVALILYFAGR